MSQAFINTFGGSASDYEVSISIDEPIANSYRIFSRLETQWRMDQGRCIGLDYSAVFLLFDAFGITDKVAMLDDIRVMEAAALTIINS